MGPIPFEKLALLMSKNVFVRGVFSIRQIVRKGSGRAARSVSGALERFSNDLQGKPVPPPTGQYQHLPPTTLLEQATPPWKRLQGQKSKKSKIF